MKTRQVDLEVSNQGSVFIFAPLTQTASEWVAENVSLESWQWFGGGFAVEPRMAAQLAQAMQADGLNLE